MGGRSVGAIVKLPNLFRRSSPIGTWSSEAKEREWRAAQDALKDEPDGTKLKREQMVGGVALTHSFIKVKGQVFAVAAGKENNARQLGKGAFGRVKYGEDEDGTAYALKILEIRSGEDLEAAQREADIIEDLSRGVGGAQRQDGIRRNDIEGNKKFVIAMEHGRKASEHEKSILSYVMGDKTERLSLALDLIKDVSRLHSGQGSNTGKRYVHRDIKLGNVVLDADDHGHLIDFGLACEAGTRDDGGIFSDGPPVGTEGFMAPEVWDGKVGFANDVFSLGVVLTGLSSPFEDGIDGSVETLRDGRRSEGLIHNNNGEFELYKLGQLMKISDPKARPNIELVKIAFLCTSCTKDKDLKTQLEANQCAITDAEAARDVTTCLLNVSNPNQYDVIKRLNKTVMPPSSQKIEFRRIQQELIARTLQRKDSLFLFSRFQTNDHLDQRIEEFKGCSNLEELCAACAQNRQCIQREETRSLTLLKDILNDANFSCPLASEKINGSAGDITAQDLKSYADRESTSREDTQPQ